MALAIIAVVRWTRATRLRHGDPGGAEADFKITLVLDGEASTEGRPRSLVRVGVELIRSFFFYLSPEPPVHIQYSLGASEAVYSVHVCS